LRDAISYSLDGISAVLCMNVLYVYISGNTYRRCNKYIQKHFVLMKINVKL